MPIAANMLERDFTAEAPNEVWVTDITYIPTREGWLYLAAILDLYSRRVVGWAMSDRITRQLTLDALSMALQARTPRRACFTTPTAARSTPATTTAPRWPPPASSAA